MSSKKQKNLEDSGKPAKKQKIEVPEGGLEYIKSLEESRKATAVSIKDFKFNKKRIRVISEAKDIPENAKGIVYWMSRDQRVQGKVIYKKF